MGKQLHCDDQLRQAATASIENGIGALAGTFNVKVISYLWNLGQDMNHAGPHRLDIQFKGSTLRMYFTDFELAGYWAGCNRHITENRIRQVLTKLGRVEADRENQFAGISSEANNGARLVLVSSR